MKKTTIIAIILCVAAIGSGCTSMSKVVTALAKDKNNVSVRVTTIYGTLTYARTGSLTTNSTTSVSSDGSITTKTP